MCLQPCSTVQEIHRTYNNLHNSTEYMACHTILRSFQVAKCRPAKLKETGMDRVWVDGKEETRHNEQSYLHASYESTKITDNTLSTFGEYLALIGLNVKITVF